MPVFGFNTDVRVGNVVLHVQTEDRGRQNPVLDTTIYLRGRVLAKRGRSYKEFLESSSFNEAELHTQLERQHREMVEEVRAGRLPEMASVVGSQPPGGISVQLVNPATFLKGTTAVLEVSVGRRQDKKAVPGARVQVSLRAGGLAPHTLEGETDAEGRATLQVPLPQLGPGGAELLIRAQSGGSEDEIKYTLRPRAKG